MTRLYHYSASPFTFDPARAYRQADGEMKPRGLWMSAEGVEDSRDWRDWCLGEEFNMDGLAHRTEIALAPDANVLYLTTAHKIDQFTLKFRSRKISYMNGLIDWPRVAQQHQGIVIAPYQWRRRMSQHTFWYYGWDCASGCIWDCAAIVVPREVVA